MVKGRIYERRCDLSPYGDRLIYFAATYKKPLFSWTAISKPPWLTAIALWPKGYGWNGGGYFLTQKQIVLNHPQSQSMIHPDFNRHGIEVVGFARFGGEDATVHHHLLERSGWKNTQRGIFPTYSLKDGWMATLPDVWVKPHQVKFLTLRMECLGIARRNQGWYDLRYQVHSKKGEVVCDLGKTDWAEWDANGDLLFAKNGKLFRAKVQRKTIDSPAMLADFNDRKFKAIKSPASART